VPNLLNSDTRKSPSRGVMSPLVKKKNAPAGSSTALTGAVEASVPTRLREIHRFLKMGAAVLPVAEGEKKPAVAGGYKAASKDRATVDARFRAKPSPP
jgi:hypothetical protein